jgi:hypothetical protein
MSFFATPLGDVKQDRLEVGRVRPRAGAHDSIPNNEIDRRLALVVSTTREEVQVIVANDEGWTEKPADLTINHRVGLAMRGPARANEFLAAPGLDGVIPRHSSPIDRR